MISPVRNEAAHLELVADAVARQTRPPELWVLVDDGSTDGTPEILAELAERIGFLKVVNVTEQSARGRVKDRLATAAAPRTFNVGLDSVDWRSFTHIAKLDGDIELPPHYFERLLAEFEHDPELGMAGGVWAEPDPHGEGDGDGWRVQPIPARASRDGIAEVLLAGVLSGDRRDAGAARVGHDRRDVRADAGLSHALVPAAGRPPPPSLGQRRRRLRGRARHGQCAYIVHFPLPWVTLRAFKMARLRPRGLSGAAFLYGYLRSAVRRVPRVEDREFRELRPA